MKTKYPVHLGLSRKETELILVALAGMNDELGNIDPKMSARIATLHEFIIRQYRVAQEVSE